MRLLLSSRPSIAKLARARRRPGEYDRQSQDCCYLAGGAGQGSETIRLTTINKSSIPSTTAEAAAKGGNSAEPAVRSAASCAMPWMNGTSGPDVGTRNVGVLPTVIGFCGLPGAPGAGCPAFAA